MFSKKLAHSGDRPLVHEVQQLVRAHCVKKLFWIDEPFVQNVVLRTGFQVFEVISMCMPSTPLESDSYVVQLLGTSELRTDGEEDVRARG